MELKQQGAFSKCKERISTRIEPKQMKFIYFCCFIKNALIMSSQLCIWLLISDRSFLVANAQSDSFHIIFCSDGFCKMTGFTRAEVMQRSSTTEFLHGPMTSQQAVNLIKEALSKGFEKHFEILYYRKDGECVCV